MKIFFQLSSSKYMFKYNVNSLYKYGTQTFGKIINVKIPKNTDIVKERTIEYYILNVKFIFING